ncbi:uncharacterized protein DFL_006365 [Arthrobotrys flagrans]|uniref:Protein kinase domain-containing protein n=1 Tax=Arthrobotrys flagrans TaxID=97331 RepID=A0A437A104_ARTFL|nr:hypothetical protein DFL_006365 [Arthrobotrys flagrans]
MTSNHKTEKLSEEIAASHVRSPLPTLGQRYLPKHGDISLCDIRTQIKIEGSRTLGYGAGPRVYKLGPYAVKLEPGTFPKYFRRVVGSDLARETRYGGDDNVSRSPTENFEREGALIERAGSCAVALIGRVFATNEDGGQLCCVGLILERGQPLDYLLEKNSYASMAEEHSLAIEMIQLIKRLHEEYKMVHRDIKPSNMVIVNGKVKLIDFDSNRPLDEDMDEKEW